MTIHELLNQRFATKQFVTDKLVSEEDLTYILEAARLSCSSANIQPWKIFVITNKELRAQLRAAAYNQPQVTEASHLLIMTTMKDPNVRIGRTAQLLSEITSPEQADKYTKMATGLIPADAQQALAWSQRQTYLALQAMILAAAEKGIDSCPMEGFDPAKFSEILGLTDVVATTLLPIGYAAQPGGPKLRVSLEEMVERRG